MENSRSRIWRPKTETDGLNDIWNYQSQTSKERLEIPFARHASEAPFVMYFAENYFGTDLAYSASIPHAEEENVLNF